MDNKLYCPLHLHSELSSLDGLGKIPQIVSRAKELNFQYVSITDHGNVDGAIRLQSECEKQGIKPVVGCELYVVPDAKKKGEKERRGHLVALVENEEGWSNLLRMLTYANMTGFYRKPRVDYATVLKYTYGLTFLTGCVQSVLYLDGGEEFFDQLLTLSPNVYLEVQPHNTKEQKELNQLCLDLSEKYGPQLVATNDIHYILKEDAEAHEVLLAIQRSAKWDDPNRWKFDESYKLYMKTADEMIEDFREQGVLSRSEYTQAMLNTVEIAERCCEFKIGKKPISLPKVPNLDYENDTKTLNDLCLKGVTGRVPVNDKGYMTSQYQERYGYEMQVIARKGFVRYFLIVKDLIDWCRRNDIMTGPCRGSVGCSLIAYLLKVTNVDPIKYDLPFTRFINEERIDFPDIDMDFEDRYRDRVIQYLINAYGEHRTAGISTFMRMKSRLVIRDVARVFDIPLEEVDKFAKIIDSSIDDAVQFEKDALKKVDKKKKQEVSKKLFHVKYQNIIEIAKKLEGAVRGNGRHAAGLIISDDDLRNGERCNLVYREGHLCINWEKDDADHQGLMKLDILGLNTLSVLSEAKELIGKSKRQLFYHPESDCVFVDNLEKGDEHSSSIPFDFERIPLDDSEVLKDISEGKTTGIFQIGTNAMTKLVKQMGIEDFSHIADAVALVRPGPSESGMTKEYIERKHGKKWEPKHPIYEEILKKTYGVITFQEQVMNIIYKVAGLPYPIADKVRKIIGKKRDVKEFEQFKEMFVDGCLKQKTLSEEEALETWEGFEKHANYSFNFCLTGDTRVHRASSGKHCKSPEITLRELYENWYSKTPVGAKMRSKVGIHILQMHSDGRIRPGKVKGIYHNGRQKVFLIKTEEGREIKATSNHRFLTDEGYRTVDELSIWDNLIVMGEYEPTKYFRGGQFFHKRTYIGHGFQEGEDNVAWVDGNHAYFQKAKPAVLKRSKGLCERCGRKIDFSKKHDGELSHIKELSELDLDVVKYQSEDNIWLICNSCHKLFDYQNGTRKKRWSKGRPTHCDSITGIELLGEEDVYDLEMEGPDHNFVANGIVSHNSHSIGYSMIAMWTAYLKHYWPHEFICATLTYGTETHKNDLIYEAQSIGLEIVPPKIGVSQAHKWRIIDNKLYVPFSEIKGIGEKVAEEIVNSCSKPSRKKGFFVCGTNGLGDAIKGKTREILEEIGAFDHNSKISNKASCQYFDFDLLGDPMETYPKLVEMVGERRFQTKPINDWLTGNVSGLQLAVKHEGIFPRLEGLSECKNCPLHKECTKPVHPSYSEYNLIICGEAPGEQEDKKGRGFIHKAGDVLWSELKKYDFHRENFHVTNTVKCYPSKTRNPLPEHINSCRIWLETELKQVRPCIVLALGGSALYFFEGLESGITRLNDSTKWNEKYGCYVCYCLHPSYVLRNPSTRPDFEKGIQNFSETVEKIGGF